MKTRAIKASEIESNWLVLDATGQTLGRLANQAAVTLMGKHKPIFSPHLDTGDHVVIVNAERVRVTGKKLEQKIYYRHSNYPGGLRAESLGTLLKRKPAWVMEHAVRGMLPRTKLGDKMMSKLRVYAGPEHPHQGQVNPGSGAEKREQRKPRPTAPTAPVTAEDAEPMST
jgi:large subunit ribosomal protein L13